MAGTEEISTTPCPSCWLTKTNSWDLVRQVEMIDLSEKY